MPNTTVTYAATAGQDEFDLTFPYNDRSHVAASVAGVSRSFTWINSTRIKLSTPAASGETVVLERNTSVDAPAVSFTDGSIFTAADLNRAVAQLLLNAQENTERKADADEIDAAIEALTNTVGEAFVPCTITSVTASGSGYVLQPTRTLPNNTGANTFFIVRVTEPHTEGGMHLTVAGINDGDPLNVTLPGGAQVTPGTFTAPCYLLISRPADALYELVGVLGGAAGSSAATPAGPLFLLEALPETTQSYLRFNPTVALPNNTGVGLFFLAKLPLDHTEGGLLATVTGINASDPYSLYNIDGVPLAPSASKAGDYILFTRTNATDFGWTVLSVFGTTAGGGGSSSSFFAPVVQTNTSGYLLSLTPAAGSSLPNNTGENTAFRMRVRYAHVEGGVVITMAGINPSDPLQLKMKSGDQVPPGTFAVGDDIEFTRNMTPGSVNEYYYELVAVYPAGLAAAGATDSAYTRIAARHAASNSADARKAARAALAGLDTKQALNANLTALSGLAGVADRIGYFTGTGALSLATLSAFGRTLIDDADAAAARTTLGLTAMATQAPSAVAITGGTAFGMSGQYTGSAVASSGSGLELLGGGSAVIQGFNRTLGTYINLNFDGLAMVFRPSGSTRLRVDSSGATATGSFKPSSYTVATLPSAGTHGAGAIVYCSDNVGGSTLVFSDGSNWRRVSDRAIASTT